MFIYLSLADCWGEVYIIIIYGHHLGADGYVEQDISNVPRGE